MDFLEIRRKAKERAATRAPAVTPPVSEEATAAATGGSEAGGPSGPLEPEGRLLTPLPVEVPPDDEPRDAPGTGEPLPPAPRWPAMADGGALVDALREELGAKWVSPVPATAASPAWEAPAPEPTPEPARSSPPVHPVSPPVLDTPAGPPAAACLDDAAEPGEPGEPDPLAEFFFDVAEVAPALEEVPAAAAPVALEPEPRREYLTFLLGAEEYAVEIERVREVLKAPAVTEVPRAPAHVLGVIMVRGDVVAVFDPRRRLGLPPAAGSRVGRVLVCDAGDCAVGLQVDAVSQVVRLRPSDVEPRPQGIGGAAAEYIAGIGRDRDRMVILLDLGTILRGAPAAEAEA